METTTKDLHSILLRVHRCILVARNVMNILGKPQGFVLVSSIKEMLEHICVSLLGPLVAKIK